MAHVFDITAAGDSVSLGPAGTGEVPFTVTNVSASAVRGRGVLGPEKSAVLPWLILMGEQERLLQPKQTDTFLVKVAVPPGTSPGDYSFRLDIVSVARPDEDSTQGPAIKIPVILAPPPSKPFPWWILLVAAFVIGGISYAALKLIPAGKVAVPDLHGKTVEQAGATLSSLHLKLGTQTKTPADKPDLDHIVGQTPAYDPKNPTLLPRDSSVNVQVGVAKPEPPPPPPPVAQPQPEAPPIASVTVPFIRTYNQSDATMTLLQMGFTPILHLIAPESRPSPDRVLGQFPREGTVVQKGSSVLITVTTDDPAKVGTCIKLSVTEKVPITIDCDEARHEVGMPDRRPRPIQ